jgi:CRISPR/Cas system endoribonuclease Cas6 (RAMP superfamily)
MYYMYICVYTCICSDIDDIYSELLEALEEFRGKKGYKFICVSRLYKKGVHVLYVYMCIHICSNIDDMYSEFVEALGEFRGKNKYICI